MNTPKIEIKNLKTAEFASEETLCFSCTVYVNGKQAFIASNQGHGGCDDYQIINKELFDIADNYVKSLPKIHYEGMDLDPNLEIFIGDMINEFQANKWLKTKCKNKTLFRLPDDKEGEYRTIALSYGADVKTFIVGKYPTAEIINERFI